MHDGFGRAALKQSVTSKGCALEKIGAHFERVDGWLIARDEGSRQTVTDEAAALELLGMAHELSYNPISLETSFEPVRGLT